MKTERYARARMGETAFELSYRRTTNRLGFSLLAFLVLFTGLHMLVDVLCESLLTGVTDEAYFVVSELCDCVAYLLSFMLPVAVFYRITPVAQRSPMLLAPRLPRRLHLLLPAGLAVVYVAAIANAFLIAQLGWTAEVNHGVVWIRGMEVYEGVLLFISSVLVPAFCEELLFRGAVLSALLPYGKSVAVVGSSVLFGLMHQTPDQLLYTTVAGLVLALLTLEGGSIWAAVMLHMLNNGLAVVETVLYEQLSSTSASHVFSVLEVVMIGGGLLCLARLVSGREVRETTPNAVASGALARPVRGFLTPAMLAFVVLCLAQIAVLVVLTFA